MFDCWLHYQGWEWVIFDTLESYGMCLLPSCWVNLSTTHDWLALDSCTYIASRRLTTRLRYQNWTPTLQPWKKSGSRKETITPKDCGQGEICCRYIFGNIEIWSRITEEGKTYYEERTENLTIGRSGVARVNPTYSSDDEDDEDFDDRGLMSIWNG